MNGKTYLKHYAKGSTAKKHKYVEKHKSKNGNTVYTYPGDPLGDPSGYSGYQYLDNDGIYKTMKKVSDTEKLVNDPIKTYKDKNGNIFYYWNNKQYKTKEEAENAKNTIIKNKSLSIAYDEKMINDGMLYTKKLLSSLSK